MRESRSSGSVEGVARNRDPYSATHWTPAACPRWPARAPSASTLPSPGATIQSEQQAEVAQLVEQLIRNQQVIGSSPIFGSSFRNMVDRQGIGRNAHAFDLKRAMEPRLENRRSIALCACALGVSQGTHRWRDCSKSPA